MIQTGGMYVYADYQFYKLYSIGMRYDWSESPYSSTDKAKGVAVFLGFYPVEETLGLRFQYSHTTTETVASTPGCQCARASAFVLSWAAQSTSVLGHLHHCFSPIEESTMNRLAFMILLLFGTWTADATIKVVTSLPDFADLTRQIGGDKVSVDYIVRADQNPHFIEVKPSYMMKLKSADIYLSIGHGTRSVGAADHRRLTK